MYPTIRHLILVGTLPVPVLAQSASFTPLPPLPGGLSSLATAISPDASTIVGESQSSTENQAVQWAGGVPTGLGFLPGGSRNSTAAAVSDAGSVVVGTSWNGTQFEGFRTVHGGGMTGLGSLAPSTQNILSQATGISAMGFIIVGYSRTAADSSPTALEAFRRVSGQLVGLGDLPGGGFGSQAFGVNAAGDIVVGQSLSANGNEAFRWDPVNGMRGLGDLPGGSFLSQAFDVSDDGSAIVGASSSALSGPFNIEPCLWFNGSPLGLGDLPGGSSDGFASGVSADGTVVVGMSETDEDYEAFVWTPLTGMRNLRRVLEDDHGLNLDGWLLQEATDISADGRTIVGFGLSPTGAGRGWVVTLPLPCYADCDSSTGPGVLDIFDFLCFQNRYDAQDPYACDCDQSTGPRVCDIFDFLCFQNAYDAGCP